MASEKVLTEFELVKYIVSFQDGIYEDIRCWFGRKEMALKWRQRALEYSFPPNDSFERKKAYSSPLGLAVFSGDLHAVESIIKCKPHLLCADIIEYALVVQQVDIASKLLCEWPNLEYSVDVRYQALQLFWTVVCEDNEELLQLLIVFFNHKYDEVIVAGFLGVLQNRHYACALALYELFHEEILSQNYDLVRYATKAGHLKLIIRLHNENAPFTSDIMNVAASYGHLDILQFLNENRSEGCTTRAMDKAAANNHLPVVQYLHSHRTESCTPDALINAIRNNHLEIVDFLLFNCPQAFTHDALYEAVECNRTDIFKYLLDTKMFEFSARAFDKAFTSDQADFVLWFVQAFPSEISTDTLVQKALADARFQVVYHLVRHGYPLELPSNMRWCIVHPDALELFQWLVNQGITLQSQWMDLAASFGTLELVEFFHENCPAGCTTDAIDGAAKKNYIAIVQYLLAKRSEGCTEAAFDSAIKNRSQTLFKLLLQHYPEKCSESNAIAALKLNWTQTNS